MTKAVVFGMFIAACAMGSSQQQQIDANSGAGHDASVKHDASSVAGDAKVFKDAATLPLDAFVPKDAPLQAGGFCTDNTNCISTQCCFVAVCVDGTGIGANLCFPAN